MLYRRVSDLKNKYILGLEVPVHLLATVYLDKAFNDVREVLDVDLCVLLLFRVFL